MWNSGRVILVLLALARGARIDVTCTGAPPSDTLRLLSAVNGSEPGDLIHIHGACVVSETVPLRGQRRYVGDSRVGTSITQADGRHLAALVASDSFLGNWSYTGAPIELAHLTLDGNRAHNNGTSTLVVRSWQAVLHDLHVVASPADGIRITNLAADNVTGLKSTQVNGRISNVFVERSGGAGIRVLDTENAVTDWNLLDSWVANSGTSAVLLDNAAGWQVRGVHTYGVQEHAIYANRCFATGLIGNYIEDFGRRGGEGRTWYGIACHAQSAAASTIATNRVHSFGADAAARSRFVFVGVSGVGGDGVGVVNVVGNVARESAGRAGSVGLAYHVGSARNALEVGSSGNAVVGMRVRRLVGAGVSIIPPV